MLIEGLHLHLKGVPEEIQDVHQEVIRICQAVVPGDIDKMF